MASARVSVTQQSAEAGGTNSCQCLAGTVGADVATRGRRSVVSVGRPDPRFVSRSADIRRLLLVTQSVAVGGMETLAIDIAAEFVRRGLDVTAIVRSVFDTLDSTAAGKGVALSIDGGSAPLWIEADPRACRQILLNLTSNAIKFTPSGGRVTVRAMIDPDGQPAVVVKDTGIGMEPDEVPAALEPFRQLDDSTARRFTGSGLGLSIAESLVRLLGGVLDIETARGRGTTVTVRLPPQRLKTSA